MAVKPAVAELMDEIGRLREKLAQTMLRTEVLECERDEWRMDWESLSAKLLNARDEANWHLTRALLQRNLARQSRDTKEDELVFLRKELAQAKLDAEIYEAMYDTKCADCKKLLVKLGQAKIFETLGNDLHEERHAYVTELEAQLTNIHRDVIWLWGFWDGNSLRAIPGFEDDIRDAWDKLLAIVKGIK